MSLALSPSSPLRSLSTLLVILALLSGCDQLGTPVGGDGDDAPAPEAASFQVMTFNIRYNNPDDAPNDWPARRDTVADIASQADLIGVQEALAGQMADLQTRLDGFDWFGVGRADGQSGGEFSAIFYREERFELLQHDTFWLSETPDVVGSVGWDAALERIATWGELRDRTTGDTLFHVNTHFDHVGVEARRESSRLLLSKIEEVAGDGAPVVLTGDFNVVDSSQVYQILTGAAPGPAAPLQDAREMSIQEPVGPNSSWNGFNEVVPGRRIDYVFTRPPVEVLEHTIIDEQIPGTTRFPSDHLPVLVRAQITE